MNYYDGNGNPAISAGRKIARLFSKARGWYSKDDIYNILFSSSVT
jgi:hypothetical protein